MTCHFFKAHDGARLAYRVDGEGQPLVALAGLSRDSRDFDYLVRHLDQCRVIRLDSRGRGESEWTGPETYTVERESADVIALLDHLGIDRAAILGSSRGGLIGLVLAATQRARVAGLCLNDVGPVIERAGLMRIGHYLGVTPAVDSLVEVMDRMPATMPGFDGVPPERWAEETVRHFTEGPDGIGLTYDPALRESFDKAMAGPLPELWDLFDACDGLPIALIHGANSDVLSPGTANEMQRRRPDMIRVEIPDRGHIPFLDEPQALVGIRRWLRWIEAGAPPRGEPSQLPGRAGDIPLSHEGDQDVS
ncbi:MAG: alpha/beta hydrolase [Bauldia sp.]|nr:alpha/beta hydrolase [Bauldia sp.]